MKTFCVYLREHLTEIISCEKHTKENLLMNLLIIVRFEITVNTYENKSCCT